MATTFASLTNVVFCSSDKEFFEVDQVKDNLPVCLSSGCVSSSRFMAHFWCIAFVIEI
jgi:hypothetical protein